MGNRCHILNQNHIKSGCLERTQCGLSTGARAFHINLNIFHPMFHSLLGRVLRCKLSSKRGTLSRPLKALRSCAGPGNHVARLIRDGHDGIVEGRLNVGYPAQYVLLLFLFPGRSCHSKYFTPYFFLFPTTLRRGPLRVLALVLVRCPRAGNDFRCRSPR